MLKPGQNVQICAPNGVYLIVNIIPKTSKASELFIERLGEPVSHKYTMQLLDGDVGKFVKSRKPRYGERNIVYEIEIQGVIVEVYAHNVKAI